MNAYITVTDAAGRVILRRRASDDEIDRALRDAAAAELEAELAYQRVAARRRGVRRPRLPGNAA